MQLFINPLSALLLDAMMCRRPTSTHQRDTFRLSYPLTDGNFLGYQINLTLAVLGKLKDIITGHHRATVALKGLIVNMDLYICTNIVHAKLYSFIYSYLSRLTLD
jgi:hypothetical protein